MLEVDKVSVFYGKIRALLDVSVSVASGEVFALIGPNGAGKTTLLRSIAGLVPCAGGRISFQGNDLSRRPAYTRASLGISIVPEGRGLLRQFTVEENLRVGAYSRTDGNEVRTDFERIYELFPQLRERRRQLAGSLSGGEGQMVAIGRALMSRPRLLLMDEPSMGLMPLIIEETFKTIVSLRRQGMSILLVEQNAKKALAVADHAAVLQLGKIILRGTPDELATNDLVRKAYFGA